MYLKKKRHGAEKTPIVNRAVRWRIQEYSIETTELPEGCWTVSVMKIKPAREILSALILFSVLALPACGGDRDVTKTASQPAASTAVVASDETTCESLDPIDALTRRLEGSVSVEIIEIFTQESDVTITQIDGVSSIIEAGEKISLTTTIERSLDGVVRYNQSVTPESFGVPYREVIFTNDSVYVSFPDGAVPGADGLWVTGLLTDRTYVESLLMSEPPTALDLRNTLFGTEGSVAAAMPYLPIDTGGVGEVTMTSSSSGACSFGVEILPEWGDSDLNVVLDTKGDVVSVRVVDSSSRVTEVKLSEGPDSVATPSDLAPDSVGRKYAQS